MSSIPTAVASPVGQHESVSDGAENRMEVTISFNEGVPDSSTTGILGNIETPQLHKLIRNKFFHNAMERLSNPCNKVEARLVDPKTGDLPILIACRMPTTPLSLIQFLLDAYPYKDVVSFLAQQGVCRRLEAPCHDTSAIVWRSESGSPMQELSTLISAEGRVPVNAEGPPLFLAVKYGLPLSIVSFLIETSGRDGLRKEATKENQLPLHVAHSAEVDVIEELVKSDGAGAAACSDVHGQLPLHCFVRSQSKQACVEVLLTIFPDALTRRDNRGRLPLHFALRHNASLVLIQSFVVSYPQAARVVDETQNLPIHHAFMEGSRTTNLAKKIETLLRVYPQSAMRKNLDGLTPADLATRTRKRGYYSSMDCNLEGPIQALLRRNPLEWMRRRPRRDNARKMRMRLELGPRNGQIHDDRSKGGAPHIRVCVVCKERDVSHALVPCGHVALCVECADFDGLIELDGCCPINKCRFFRAQKIFGKGEAAATSPSEAENRCVICLDGVRSHALVPCGHVLLCGGCANRDVLKRLDRGCPLARCRIRSVMKIEWCRHRP